MTNSPSKNGCIILALFLVAAAVVLVAGGFVAHEVNPARAAERQQAIEEARARAARDDTFWRSVLPAQVVAYSILVVGMPVGIPLAAAVAGYAWLRRRHRNHAELVYPNADGLLPVSRAGLLAGQYDAHSATAIAGHHAARIEAARNTSQPIPSSVTHYAPKYSSAAPRPTAGQDAPQALAAPPTTVETAPPSFAELLSRRWVGPGYLMLGWDAARSLPAYGTFADLLSFAILGSTGSGKSTSARALLAQSALNGAKLCIIDPHMRAAAGQSVAGELAPFASCFEVDPIDDDPGDVGRVLQHMLDILERRKRGEQGPPVILVIDEWTSLVSRGGPRAAQLTQAARLLAIEGRKVGLHAALLLQDCTKESAGPVRDVLSSSIIHRTRPSMARLIAPGIAGQDTWTLAPGQMIMDTRGGIRRLTMPNCEPSDVQALARLLPAPTVTGPRSDSASWTQTPEAPPRPPLRVVRPDDVDEDAPPTPTTPRDAGDMTAKGESAPPPPTPPTLSGRAAAAGMVLDDETRRLVEAMDAGKTASAAAASLCNGSYRGGRYDRLRRKAQDMQQALGVLASEKDEAK